MKVVQVSEVSILLTVTTTCQIINVVDLLTWKFTVSELYLHV